MSVLSPRTSKGPPSRRSFLAAAVRGLAVILSAKVAPSVIRAAVKAGENEPATREELIFRSASELARLIRSRTISSEEMVRACLARISEVNPKLNAVCQIDEKGALAAARDADAVLMRGGEVGKLHGVPMTIKDSFDTKGIVSNGRDRRPASFCSAKKMPLSWRACERPERLSWEKQTPPN